MCNDLKNRIESDCLEHRRGLLCQRQRQLNWFNWLNWLNGHKLRGTSHAASRAGSRRTSKAPRRVGIADACRSEGRSDAHGSRFVDRSLASCVQNISEGFVFGVFQRLAASSLYCAFTSTILASKCRMCSIVSVSRLERESCGKTCSQ